MFSIVRDSPDFVVFEQKKYLVDLSFDRVLLFYEFLQKEEADQAEIVSLGLSLLCRSKEWQLLSIYDQARLLNVIFEEHVNTDKRHLEGPKVMDFLVDAGRIYAGFLQAYGIDLLKQRGILPWSTFIALLEGLPADTKFREVIAIRARKMPNPTKYNAEERAELLKLKQYYSLEKAVFSYEEGLEKLWAYARSHAERR